ncbi:MAG: hypothetical protein DME65_08680 [Verrucomicrobia bacterium]|nr:MAG: hypothetical protein DME65_08680 [Verrucomicrobiota bacterium]
MKQFLFAALTIVVAMSSAWASLGDSSDTIEDLYGNLLQRQLRDDGTVSGLYHKGQYFYLVVFANDESISESYSHTNRTDLSEKEIAKFLKLNAAGGKWIDISTSKERRFKRSDDRAEATYGSLTGRRALTVRELGRHSDQ